MWWLHFSSLMATQESWRCIEVLVSVRGYLATVRLFEARVRLLQGRLEETRCLGPDQTL